jgi:hypothetical protein
MNINTKVKTVLGETADVEVTHIGVNLSLKGYNNLSGI